MVMTIIGIVLIVLLGTFAFCACKVASISDKEMEEYLEKRSKDEKEDL